MYKDGSRAESIKIFVMAVDPELGIRMKRKELTETFMMISNLKNLWSAWCIQVILAL